MVAAVYGLQIGKKALYRPPEIVPFGNWLRRDLRGACDRGRSLQIWLRGVRSHRFITDSKDFGHGLLRQQDRGPVSGLDCRHCDIWALRAKRNNSLGQRNGWKSSCSVADRFRSIRAQNPLTPDEAISVARPKAGRRPCPGCVTARWIRQQRQGPRTLVPGAPHKTETPIPKAGCFALPGRLKTNRDQPRTAYSSVSSSFSATGPLSWPLAVTSRSTSSITAISAASP
jgi:hypothetical protein